MQLAPTGLAQDLRSGFRSIRNDPSASLLAIFTLALGIAVNTNVFSWVDRILLQPVPGAVDAGRLVVLEEVPTSGQTISAAYPDFRDFQKGANLLSGLAAWHLSDFTIGQGQDAQRVRGQIVSANFFSVLGIRPAAGRLFLPSEDRDEEAAYPNAVISDNLWRARFQRDPRAVGAAIRVNGRPVTIVGVAPPEFAGTLTGHSLDLWVHLGMLHVMGGCGSWPIDDRNAKPLALFGRLRPGVTVEQADSQIKSIAGRIAAEHPATHSGTTAVILPIWRANAGAQALLRAPLGILTAFSALVLVIACANVANLLLARAVSRRREFGMRRALGAGRWRLLRQVFVESAILTIPAVAVGLLLTLWLGTALASLMPANDVEWRRFLDAGINARMLAFASAVCAVTAFLSGLAPALYSSRTDVAAEIAGGSRSTDSARPHRARNLLVVAEVALASVALIGAGLFLRSFQQVSNLQLGLDPDDLQLASFQLSTAGYSAEREIQFTRTLRQRLADHPGVESVSYGIEIPLAQEGDETLEIEGYLPSPGESLVIPRNNVGPDYFRTLRIPLLAGREFTGRDAPGAPSVVVINQSFANRFFPGLDPLGRRVRIAQSKRWSTIVGLAADSKYRDPAEDPRPYFYAPFQQQFASGHGNHLYFRTRGNPAAALQALRQAVAGLDSATGLYAVRPFADHLRGVLYAHYIAAALMSALGVLAMLLAAGGLYSVMAYAVSERRQEIGIRMALGARPAAVLRMVLRQALTLAFAGLLLGAASTLAASRLLAGMLVGITPADPRTYLGAAILLAAVALLAGYLPARRATRVSPITALRTQ